MALDIIFNFCYYHSSLEQEFLQWSIPEAMFTFPWRFVSALGRHARSSQCIVTLHREPTRRAERARESKADEDTFFF